MSSIPRAALSSLKTWRLHPLRKPLLLRGARQVGKSYLVRQFGLEFDHFEVKSGRFGHMKSLKLFLESHLQSPYGLKISESNETDFKTMHSIPFYSIQEWLTDSSER